ncbi:MAG: glycosyltransferase, partial [Bacteroidetes bacterium]|nr:glycosyltransferase [Bacteroidota bacterium]
FYEENYVDLFINVSETEGIPVSIMEAQSAAIPVLATNVGGTSEIVDNENGFLIDKDFEVAKIAESIEKYFTSHFSHQEEKRKKSYQNWQKKYDAKKIYAEFAEKIFCK